jgi:glycerol-3-phosphate dehydrogenase
MYDYVIIGSGIVGTTIARALSRYQLNIVVLEKENDVANHQTVANSAIIHSGHDPEEGSLKAKLCVLGNQMYETLEKELDIPLLYTGAFVVAHSIEQDEQLRILFKRAISNGVRKVELLTKEQALSLEPNLSKEITSVLSLPTTKVTFPWEVAFGAMENAMDNGVQLKLNSEVVAISFHQEIYTISLKNGEQIKTYGIINASGVFSDIIANMIEKEVQYKIKPRKGEYFVLDRRVIGFIDHVIYPLPTAAGKGVLLVPQVHGNILVGPTSEEILDREDLSSSSKGLAQIVKDAKLLSPNIPFDRNIRTFAGIRASSTYKDFFIQESKEFNHFYHVAGIDSPGLTAAPAIAEYVVELIEKKYGLVKKDKYNPIRTKHHMFHHLDEETQKALYKEDSRYGNIICKCERITEKDIINVIHKPLGADTIKGIKKRARAGAGLCQGGYCEANVLRIISRETKQDITKVNYYDLNTPILLKETKVK